MQYNIFIVEALVSTTLRTWTFQAEKQIEAAMYQLSRYHHIAMWSGGWML
jgi:hypothetical protein